LTSNHQVVQHGNASNVTSDGDFTLTHFFVYCVPQKQTEKKRIRLRQLWLKPQIAAIEEFTFLFSPKRKALFFLSFQSLSKPKTCFITENGNKLLDFKST
jgi:hypothetical protein